MIRNHAVMYMMAGAAIAILAIVPAGLEAQRAPSVLLGERVRLWSPEPIEGKVLRATPDTIVLQSVSRGPVAVSGPSIERFERWVPGRSRAAAGGLLGGLVGIGISALIIRDCTDQIIGRDVCFMGAAMLVMPLSAGGGAAIGHAMGLGGWREFRLPDRDGAVVAR